MGELGKGNGERRFSLSLTVMLFLGFDIGSSSVKASVVDAHTGKEMAKVQSPENELSISAPQPGWAEQDPEVWWQHVKRCIALLSDSEGISLQSIQGIGISYQMHGLVLVDENGVVLRPSIIWCDSRAVHVGKEITQKIGSEHLLVNNLNTPGNFTFSKLLWVKQNEPQIFEKVHTFMLPGDFIAWKLTGEMNTTASGLSEGILWNFKENRPSTELFNTYGISTDLIPEIRETFSNQGTVTDKVAQETGLSADTPVLYRAGDQPNNALSLGVLNNGEVAATGGTSGVVYAVTNEASTREGERINCFAHVNHSPETPRIGKLLCINGTGILYSWLRNLLGTELSYAEMNELSKSASIGAKGLCVLPFGNGAERMLYNKNKGCEILHLDFNRHSRADIIRAALEGVAFSFVYGLEILRKDGVDISLIKAGNDNLFQSHVFSSTIANTLQITIERIETSGSTGAARGAGWAAGSYSDWAAAFSSDKSIDKIVPSHSDTEYVAAYELWKKDLNAYIKD